MVKKSDIPERCIDGEFLFCTECFGEYSATRGDYFWMKNDEPFICDNGHPKTNMKLVKRVSKLVVLHA